jgi:hypothetical protein
MLWELFAYLLTAAMFRTNRPGKAYEKKGRNVTGRTYKISTGAFRSNKLSIINPKVVLTFFNPI